MMINRSSVFFVCVSCLVTILFSVYYTTSYKIIFCDVGQGAATLLQLGTYQILVDTGPDQRVLSCIGRHIPFLDHTIETIIISHNQKDHNGGLSALLHKYSVKHVYGPLPKMKQIGNSQFTEVKDRVVLQNQFIKIVILKASQSSKDINESANVVTIKTLQEPLHTIFLSSDISGLELKKLLPKNTTLLEVPHHGSKYGLFPDSIGLAHPITAVISVGKKNTYGHPAKDVLDILKAKKIKVWRTDEQGELVVNLK